MEKPGAPAFVSSIPFPEKKSETLVICCGDHRYRAQIEDFLRNGLKLTAFDELVVPGGAEFLFAAAHLPKFEWAGRRWLRFLVEHHGLREIICIAHEDCGWYKNLMVGPLNLSFLKDRQLSDLRKVPAALHEVVPGLRVRLFFARCNEKGQVEFVSI